MIPAVCCANCTWLTGSIVGFIVGLCAGMVPSIHRAFYAIDDELER